VVIVGGGWGGGGAARVLIESGDHKDKWGTTMETFSAVHVSL
jgi:NADPH-dependent 2,4-dienoyl-CoA reductase/sulfur reductase-like enzyme